jgi:hypothetical protein
LDIETIEALAAVSEVELADAHVDAAQLLAESAARLLEVRPIGKTVFSRWAELVQSS